MPEVQESGEEFVIATEGFENVGLTELKDRCAFWKSIGGKIPI